MGLFGMLFGVNKMNADPDQQELAKLFIECVGRPLGGIEIRSWLAKKHWSNSEASNRVTHALSMVKVWRSDLYPAAKRIGYDVYMNFLQEDTPVDPSAPSLEPAPSHQNTPTRLVYPGKWHVQPNKLIRRYVFGGLPTPETTTWLRTEC